ncbi:DNA polymerase III subunit alpha [Candidatus Uhrbacteria bacterium]|nr:DNA polymerase III subunit alpha [Candidatus Uhrbacteria bacterium]
MPSPFVHLHVHSHYSLLEALPKVKELVKFCDAQNMDAMALTDNGVLYGAIEFYQKMTEAGKKPLIGMDVYLAPYGRTQKRARIDTRPWRLVLLAENETGYRNLMKLSSQGFLEGFYYKPRLDDELLASMKEGLICLSGGYHSELATLARQGADRTKLREVAERYRDMFGPEHFYLELVDRPELAEQRTVNSLLVEIGKECGIPLVVTRDAYYLARGDQEAWRVQSCIQGSRTLEEVERGTQNDFDASLSDAEGIAARFADLPEAIENTRRIADRCNLTLDLGKWNFANIDIPAGKTAIEFLRERAYAELAQKVPEITEEMQKRLDYELGVIDFKAFAPYFLIVSDYIQYARRNGIVTTTRGSAAGSLVSYAIGISTVDPLRYRLPFERFLNPERPSAPDVDGDFADNRRDEMLAYVTEKYGADKVAQICTFGTMLARGSVRDVGRALGFSYGFVDGVAKLVPMGSQGFPMTLERALGESPDLKKRYDTEPDVRRVIDVARRIEGRARHVSIHAAGTVIAPTPLVNFTPLQRDTREGKVITQYEMKSVEAAGLLKMDFLGIRNLSILGDAVKLVRKLKGVEIELEKIPVDDGKTFSLLARGETMGLFQLNGDGMTKYLMELKPERIEDIMAMVALYRPGPIESIPEYIRRKHNASLIQYLDPRMESILDMSYGVIVYQDDVMLIAIHLAGYSWLEADKLRKAMGKKIPEEMAKQKEKLLEGFVAHGLSAKKAHELWLLIEPFAAYGFNKAHAASYGMVAYQTAYMKANYPAEYMTALMTAEASDLDKIAAAVTECRRMGMDVLGPDVNISFRDFTYVDDKTIRFGLLVVKNLGVEVVNTIVEERKTHGTFTDLADFAARVTHRAFNKKSLEALIKAGALDVFGERRQMLENVDQILAYNKHVQKAREQKQTSFFDLSPSATGERLSLSPAPAASRFERLAWEKELLGLYVSAHPWSEVLPHVSKYVVSIADAIGQKPDTFARVGGMLSDLSVITTKKGDQMAFARLGDGRAQAEVIFFPRTYAECKDHIKNDAPCLISVKISKREEEEVKLVANSIIPISFQNISPVADMLHDGLWLVPEASEQEPKTVSPAGTGRASVAVLPVQTPKEEPGRLNIVLRGRPDRAVIGEIREALKVYPGNKPVFLLVESIGRFREVETEYRVSLDPALLENLRNILGPQNIEVG